MSLPSSTRRPAHGAVGARRAATGLAALLILGLACVSKPPAPRPATVRVEVVRGAAGMPEIPAAPLYAVVDMRRPGGAGADPDLLLHATRRAARRHFGSLSQDVPVGLVVLGEGLGETCGDPALIEDPPLSTGPELGTRLNRFAAEPPASLAAALELVSARLAGEAGDGAPARVLVFSTLGSHCPRDVCAPAQRLVAQGAQLDWVVLGDVPAPECLAQLRAPLADGGVHAAVLPQPPAEVAFRVEPRGGHPGYHRGDAYVPAALEGRSGGPALQVAPGLVEVRISLETPLNLWPVRLSPDRETRIRVLDFPTLGLQRSFVETEPEGWPWFVPRRFR